MSTTGSNSKGKVNGQKRRVMNSVYFILILGILHCNFLPVSSIVYTDCTSACNFRSDDPNPIEAGNVVASITLPRLFQISFDVQIAGNNNIYPTLTNLIEVYSVSLKKSLLTISLEPVSNSNQVHIVYNNQLVVEYGPPVVFSPTAFSSLTVTVQEFSITFSSQVWGKTYPIGGAILSSTNILYASSKTVDVSHVSAVGNIQNFVVQGAFLNSQLLRFLFT